MPDLRRLDEAIACSLAGEVKSYNLPQVCVDLGLQPGDTSEAHASKRLYVEKRLQGKSQDVLIALAHEILKSYPNYWLQEVVAKLDPDEGMITEITRRSVVKVLNGLEHLSGEFDLLDFLNRLWPISLLQPTGFDFRCSNLQDEITQHMILNKDWTTDDLLNSLTILTISQHRFFRFLELVIHPVGRRGEEQKTIVDALNEHLKRDGFSLVPTEQVSGFPVFSVEKIKDRVAGHAKNLIFAAAGGPKPEIVISDAINNDIQIVRYSEFCLVYDRPILSTGLRWKHLVEWWAERENLDPSLQDTGRSCYKRLSDSLGESPPERLLFRRYFEKFLPIFNDEMPALVPQVYLHYDPYTRRQLGNIRRLPRQRMDFLLLLSSCERIVIEIDGKQHYSDGEKASPSLYAEMVEADRDLRLSGYEIYRFGGYEIRQDSLSVVDAFFESLFRKHCILPGSRSGESPQAATGSI